MPSRINPPRWLIWVGAVVILLAFAASAPPGQDTTSFPSIYSSGSSGARAAYLLLRDMRVNVQAWEDQPANIPTAPQTTLILAEPTEPPSKPDIAALAKFVSDGGRVLFCGAAIKSFFPAAEISPPVLGIDWQEFAPALPSAITRDADRIVMRPEVYWKPSAAQITLYGKDGNDAVISWPIGSGEVIWWAGATPLTNAGISRADNLNLFLNSLGSPSVIYWDEYFHGERASLISYVEKTPVIWAGLQILIAALAVLFTFSRRSGPIVAPRPASRLSPLEFVNTMGALYRHAGAASIPVDVSRRHLRLELTRRLGLPSQTAVPDLAQSAAGRLDFDATDLAAALTQASPSNTAALDIVQRLARYTDRLRTPFHKENN